MIAPDALERRARELGFIAVGVARAELDAEARFVFHERIDLGMYDGLPWFTHERAERAADATRALPGARSVITLAAPYKTAYAPVSAETDPAAAGALRGRMARYAWGRDYHRALERRLKALAAFIDAEYGVPAPGAGQDGMTGAGASSRGLVDYGPLAERACAARAGIGWFGKHTNLLLPGFGSWVLLAELITTVAFEPTRPLVKSCGACTRCATACPTGAISGPYVVDNRRCISYQTIENRGWIPRELRPLLGDWVFGCDLCQDACPVGAGGASRSLPELEPATLDDAVPELTALLALSDAEFFSRFRGRAIIRAKRAGLARNACVALGNLGDARAVPPLARSLHTDPAAIVRGHAAWALGRIGGAAAVTALQAARAAEQDADVLDEIRAALSDGTAGATGTGVVANTAAWLAGPWQRLAPSPLW